MVAAADSRDAVLALLNLRDPAATICPSEVARRLAGPDGDWRARMPAVHDAVDRLLATGKVRLSWQGVRMASRTGPYRIGRSDPGEG